jgi:cysteine-rich repeat protein
MLYAALVAVAAPVQAHGPLAPFTSWGGFTPDAARCQRILAQATATCIGQAVAADGACSSGALTGTACDADALASTLAAEHSLALARIAGACTSAELRALGYLDAADAATDVDAACTQIDTAATSAAFGPATIGGAVQQVDAPAAACMRGAAREAIRLLRLGMIVYAQVLDRVAALALPPAEKQALVAWAAQHIAQTQSRSHAELAAACDESTFSALYGRAIDSFLTNIAGQAACMAQLVYLQDGVRCPTPVCGNGVQEPGEQCDDGNSDDGDGCRADCVKTNCVASTSTFDLIQHAVFDTNSCTGGACHGSAQSGGLDLRDGVSYDLLVGVPSSLDATRERVEPGDPDHSILFLKVAAKTLPDQYPADALGIGVPMPQGPVPPISQDDLQALRLWILGQAPRTGTVDGVSALLNGCTPQPRPFMP